MERERETERDLEGLRERERERRRGRPSSSSLNDLGIRFAHYNIQNFIYPHTYIYDVCYLDSDDTAAEALLVHLAVRLFGIVALVVLQEGEPVSTRGRRDITSIHSSISRGILEAVHQMGTWDGGTARIRRRAHGQWCGN